MAQNNKFIKVINVVSYNMNSSGKLRYMSLKLKQGSYEEKNII